MDAIQMVTLCAFNLLFFIVGAKIGQASAKGREIRINPVRAIKEEIKEVKAEKKESLRKRKVDTMLQNIDMYDGTGLGQKQIPKD